MTNCNPSRRECYPCNREKMLPLHREIHFGGGYSQGSHALHDNPGLCFGTPLG
jgi:hypothetical protein